MGGASILRLSFPPRGDYTIKLLVDRQCRCRRPATASALPQSMSPLRRLPRSSPALRNFLIFTTIKYMPPLPAPALLLPDSTVYLRGFAIDINPSLSREFNPDAPCFDIYENKNGNFSTSAFDYSWTLKDKNNTDLTYLLNPSSTSENVSFTVPGGTPAGDYFTASLTVTDDEAAVSAPSECENYGCQHNRNACTSCHSVPGYANTAHASVGTGCQSCHGPGSVHVADPSNNKLSSSYWSGCADNATWNSPSCRKPIIPIRFPSVTTNPLRGGSPAATNAITPRATSGRLSRLPNPFMNSLISL